MLIWVLALIDVFGAISAAGLALGMPLYSMQAASALALILKGIIFYDDIVSWLDIVCGIMLFVLFWANLPTIALAMAVYLGFKGLMSFF
jgi:hypothetical protein